MSSPRSKRKDAPGVREHAEGLVPHGNEARDLRQHWGGGALSG
jgi:hypothetical protein